jgi:hypothetical protein
LETHRQGKRDQRPRCDMDLCMRDATLLNRVVDTRERNDGPGVRIGTAAYVVSSG